MRSLLGRWRRLSLAAVACGIAASLSAQSSYLPNTVPSGAVAAPQRVSAPIVAPPATTAPSDTLAAQAAVVPTYVVPTYHVTGSPLDLLSVPVLPSSWDRSHVEPARTQQPVLRRAVASPTAPANAIAPVNMKVAATAVPAQPAPLRQVPLNLQPVPQAIPDRVPPGFSGRALSAGKKQPGSALVTHGTVVFDDETVVTTAGSIDPAALERRLRLVCADRAREVQVQGESDGTVHVRIVATTGLEDKLLIDKLSRVEELAAPEVRLEVRVKP